MREIEVKAILRDKLSVVRKLQEMGCDFEDEITQSDVVFVKEMGDLSVFLSNTVFLRIREQNGKKIIFTLKSNGDSSLSKTEHEVVVDSKDEIQNIIKAMGYKEAVTTRKTRLATNYKGYELCIDDIVGLGSFIEVEKVTDEGESALIQEEMFQLLESLGVEREDRVYDGYDILTLKKYA